MKYVVFILALVASAGAGYLGYKWYTDSNDPMNKLIIEGSRQELAVNPNPRLEAILAEYDGKVMASKILLGAGGLGLLGAIIVLMNRGLLAALIMIPAPLVAGYFAIESLVFSGGLVLAGCLAVFVWPPKKDKDAGRRRYRDREEEPMIEAAAVEEEVAVAEPQMIDRFQCQVCHSVLRTGNPVPVGKKIHCPKCKSITRIRPLNTGIRAGSSVSRASGTATMRQTTAPKSTRRVKESEEEPVAAKSGSVAGWLLFLVAIGISGSLVYLKLKTTLLDDFILGN